MVLISELTEIKMNHKNEKLYREYIKLMHAKRFFLCFTPLVMCVLFMLPLPFYVEITGMSLSIYISSFVFLSKNTCPWCKEPFFIYTSKGMDSNGVSFLFRKKCINCGRPFDDDIAS